ncbi:MAG: zinc/manganese transport system permease protein [Fimbriimonadaceae bacterium]|jgi:zinc/manganese transport system permease protein|nr:zinc/manganese transport system permease protein [Fimbriimonadaceae bacterium]
MFKWLVEFFNGQSALGFAPLAAMVMAPVHCLFGLHIVRRGVIFIDLAVAQFAALGMAFAVMRGHEVGTSQAYWISLGFALVGALMISLSKFKLGRVPHEAMIGIYFVAASALGIILLENTPHGVEELRDMLTGNIIFVEQKHLVSTAWIYAAIVVVLILLWRPIVAVSLREPNAPKGAMIVLYDFIFYSLLAFVVASSVQIAGVLLVFTWLVMPAVAVFFWVSRMKSAVRWALPVSILMSLFGLWASEKKDWPTGATMVVVLASVVAVSYVARLLIPMRPTAEQDTEIEPAVA